MQPAPLRLWRAQHEVQKAAHSQDLIEVPRRAALDRQAEGIEIPTAEEAHEEAATNKSF
jgi:hypothetical protein